MFLANQWTNLLKKDGALLGAITPKDSMVFLETEKFGIRHLGWTALIAFYEKEFRTIQKICPNFRIKRLTK
jgi:hypothetical protein